MEKQEAKKILDVKFKELEKLVKETGIDPRAMAVAITNLQTAKMWAVKSVLNED